MFALESLIRNESIREVNPTTKRLVKRCLNGEWAVQFKAQESVEQETPAAALGAGATLGVPGVGDRIPGAQSSSTPNTPVQGSFVPSTLKPLQQQLALTPHLTGEAMSSTVLSSAKARQPTLKFGISSVGLSFQVERASSGSGLGNERGASGGGGGLLKTSKSVEDLRERKKHSPHPPVPSIPPQQSPQQPLPQQQLPNRVTTGRKLSNASASSVGSAVSVANANTDGSIISTDGHSLPHSRPSPLSITTTAGSGCSSVGKMSPLYKEMKRRISVPTGPVHPEVASSSSSNSTSTSTQIVSVTKSRHRHPPPPPPSHLSSSRKSSLVPPLQVLRASSSTPSLKAKAKPPPPPPPARSPKFASSASSSSGSGVDRRINSIEKVKFHDHDGPASELYHHYRNHENHYNHIHDHAHSHNHDHDHNHHTHSIDSASATTKASNTTTTVSSTPSSPPASSSPSSTHSASSYSVFSSSDGTLSTVSTGVSSAYSAPTSSDGSTAHGYSYLPQQHSVTQASPTFTSFPSVGAGANVSLARATLSLSSSHLRCWFLPESCD